MNETLRDEIFNHMLTQMGVRLEKAVALRHSFPDVLSLEVSKVFKNISLTAEQQEKAVSELTDLCEIYFAAQKMTARDVVKTAGIISSYFVPEDKKDEYLCSVTASLIAHHEQGNVTIYEMGPVLDRLIEMTRRQDYDGETQVEEFDPKLLEIIKAWADGHDFSLRLTDENEKGLQALGWVFKAVANREGMDTPSVAVSKHIKGHGYCVVFKNAADAQGAGPVVLTTMLTFPLTLADARLVLEQRPNMPGAAGVKEFLAGFEATEAPRATGPS